MKLNLIQLALTVGLSLGIISIASVAEASPFNGTSLTGQTTEKQPQQHLNGSVPPDTSSTVQKTEKQLTQQLNGLPHNGSSLTGQVSQKQQKR